MRRFLSPLIFLISLYLLVCTGEKTNGHHRRLQEEDGFEDLDERSPASLGEEGRFGGQLGDQAAPGGALGGVRGGGGSRRGRKKRKKVRFDPRPNQVKLNEEGLGKQVEDIINEADRYHMWWTGPPNDPSTFIGFQPESWSRPHNPNANAIFSLAVVQGANDRAVCSSPNNLVLFLGSARRVFDGDIVIALETEQFTDKMKRILEHYRATVYLLPPALCTQQLGDGSSKGQIYCGSAEERVPATVFRYYFYEKWAANYNTSAHILLSDFRDIFFQANPFTYHVEDWVPSYQLAVFQEFYPNMLIQNCQVNRFVMQDCFGDDALQRLGSKTVISAGAVLGTRDAVLFLSHHMTRVSV